MTEKKAAEAVASGSAKPDSGRAGKAGSAGKARSKQQLASDIGVVGMLRWAWRQLTTMRVALILLLLLALAAIPGSLLPQRIQDPGRVATFIEENGQLGQVLDTLQLYDVYSSVWFSSIYILLMVSLVGCIVPRTKQHIAAMRKAPPRAPRRLSRMPAHAQLSLGGRSRDELLDAAAALLKKRGYRIARADDHVAAERGYLRETGNLLFHVALLGVVIVMALGSLLGYSGQRVLVEGETFTNSLVSYDSFEPGSYYDPNSLAEYRLTLNFFETRFDDTSTGAQFGQPRLFDADVTVTTAAGSRDQILRPNEPVRVEGSRVYLIGNGYAPVVTLRDADGEVTFSGPVVFLPQDGAYSSRGVIKVPDATPEQLGFVGILLPTAALNDDGELISSFAELRNPLLVLSGFRGDLGLDDGVPQSVYQLDADRMQQMLGPDGQPLTLDMQPGDTVELPDGAGSITFDEVKKYIALDVRRDPVQGWMLLFSGLLLAGLALSLFVPRRRMWVRVGDDGAEVAGLARGEDPRVAHAVEDLVEALRIESDD